MALKLFLKKSTETRGRDLSRMLDPLQTSTLIEIKAERTSTDML
jgi:hypothetical protein